MLRRIALTPLTALIALVACGDATGSSEDPRELAPGDERSGTVALGDTAWYEYRARQTELFFVVLRAQRGTFTLSVRDPAGRTVAGTTASGTPPIVAQNVTADIAPPVDGLYRVLVTGEGRFRIEVRRSLTAPEHAPPKAVYGDTIRELVDRPDDVDDFYLHGSPGDLIIAYIQALDPQDQRLLRMDVFCPGFAGEILVRSTSQATELETQATGRLPVENGDPCRFRVAGPYVGPYRLMVRRIDVRPESVPPTAVENDTTFERLDYVGDIDDFVISGPAGTRYNVMLRLTNGDRESVAEATVVVPESAPSEPSVTSSGRDSLLTDRATGRFTLGAGGSALVRVAGRGAARGPYELFIYRINPRPEGSVSELVTPDSVLTEQIELPGDIDDFMLDVPADDTVMITLTADPASPWSTGAFVPLDVSLISSAGVTLAAGLGTAFLATGPVAVPGGRYTVRVSSIAASIDGYLGPYRLVVYRFRSAPECGPAEITMDEVVVDAIDPAGDVDRYLFHARQGDHVDIRFQQLEATEGGGLVVALVRLPDGFETGVVLSGHGAGPEPGLHWDGTIHHRGRRRLCD